MDMERRYIERLYIEDVPASNSLGYVKKKVEKYRKRHTDFNNYLIELSKKLDDSFTDVLSVINNTFDETNKVRGKNSIFNILVKLYNYHFDIKKTFCYLQMSKDVIEYLPCCRFEIKDIYYTNFGEIEFEIRVVLNDTSELKDYWPCVIYFKTNKDLSYFGINFESEKEKLEDGYVLFDGYSSYSKKILEDICSNYLDILKYFDKLQPMIKDENKLSITNIQKECKVGFKLASKMYSTLRTMIYE